MNNKREKILKVEEMSSSQLSKTKKVGIQIEKIIKKQRIGLKGNIIQQIFSQVRENSSTS